MKSWFLVIIGTFLLVGCGGGGGGGSSETVTLSGHVVNGPITGANVEIFSANGELVGSTFTDNNGFYEHRGLPQSANGYRVVASNGFLNGLPYLGALIAHCNDSPCVVTPLSTAVDRLAEQEQLVHATAHQQLFDWLSLEEDPFFAAQQNKPVPGVDLDSVRTEIRENPAGVTGWVAQLVEKVLQGDPPPESLKPVTEPEPDPAPGIVDGPADPAPPPAPGGSGSSGNGIDTYDVIANGIPKFAGVDYIELAKVYRISKFRSGIGHTYSDNFESCRSMKHYFNPKDGVDWSTIKIFSPVEGTISKIDQEWAGTQVWIKSKDYPAFYLIIFHINLSNPLNVGESVTAGQQLGSHIGPQTMSDIAVGVNTPSGWKLISYLDVMTDSVFQNYQARGISLRTDAIISKEVRDGDPLTCSGETFTNSGNLENWITLN